LKELELLKWFETSAKPFLARHASDRLGPLVSDCERLEKLLDAPDKITVCFLGNSGIGKSTLLNALAAGAEQILPAGGIGPLTAQATEVYYSEIPIFKVVYHQKRHLWRVASSLEQRLLHQQRAERKSQGDMDEVSNADLVSDLVENLDEEDRVEILHAVNGVESDEVQSDPLADNIKQARQIVTGNQFSECALPYLVDALRLACENKQMWGQSINEADMARVERIKRIFRNPSERTYSCEQTGSGATFKEDLKTHAAGFLSPLIERIDVGWPSDVLRAGVVLVDLPGVGIAEDSYRDVTKHYVREKARAVIVVVDRAGPTESTVNLLRDSGYWQRLVGASDDPNSDPCSMLMVVTKADDVAAEEWRNAVIPEGQPRPKKHEVFTRLVEEFKPRMRAQISEQLLKIVDSENDSVSAARDQARDSILGTLEVHPVSAPELRKILLDDEDDQPFLRTVEQSGIPNLRNSLVELSRTERANRRSRLDDTFERLASSVLNELQIVDQQWRQEGRAAEEAERLENALAEILAPQRKEYDRRVGAFREYLETTVQAKIEALVGEAKAVAETEVNLYLRSLQNVHWGTLRAAVRRGGAFHGSRIINLPDDISNYFQEPMAAVWGQKLLKDIRKRTTELSNDIEQMVEEICSWAATHGGASVNKKLLENQQQRVHAMSEQMKVVGKEAVDELRNTVKTRLLDEIRKPIKRSCEKFVSDGNDQGPGVKYRIIDLFRTLAANATKAAQQPAIHILQNNFSEVRGEIQGAFHRGGDPIQSTADLIVESHEARIKRSDAQKRGRILGELETIFAGSRIKVAPTCVSIDQQSKKAPA
jgi:GTP-binding protein EngB required for normal cell division